MRAAIPVSEWARAVYAAVDGRDADGFARHLAEDVWARFGNAPAVVGREAARAGFAEFFASVAGIEHTFTGEWRQDDALVLEAEVAYTRHDGSAVRMPVVTVFRLRGDLARRCQIFMDIAPLYVDAEPPALCRSAPDAADRRVDEAGRESFPASDPPTWEPLAAGAPKPARDDGEADDRPA